MLKRRLLSLGIMLLLPAVATAQVPADTAVPVPPAAAEAPAVTPAPPAPVVELPQPVDYKVVDLPNDGGNAVGVLWDWDREVPEDSPALVSIQTQLTSDLLSKYELSDRERNVIDNARARLREELEPLL